MSLRYESKVVLITGGARGIGKGCVQEFVKEGSVVVFCDIRDELGKETEAEINAIGPGKCSYIRCDVSVEEEIKSLIQETVDRHGQLDCIVNVAGCHPPMMPIDSFSSADFKELFNVNLLSIFCTSKYGLPYLRKTKGNIINISSMNATIGQKGACTYSATKGGVSAFTRSLAVDEGSNHVRVNSVSPGAIDTPLLQENFATDESNKALELVNNYSHLGRTGEMSEVAKACVYLAADATFCTGAELNVSGGAELAYSDKRT